MLLYPIFLEFPFLFLFFFFHILYYILYNIYRVIDIKNKIEYCVIPLKLINIIYDIIIMNYYANLILLLLLLFRYIFCHFILFL